MLTVNAIERLMILMATIYLNPGHDRRWNGSTQYDSGAPGYGVAEADIASDIGFRVRELLEKSGYTVLLRQSDNLNYDSQYSELNNEPAVLDEANNSGADIFVSIHCNAFNGIASGTETLYYPGSTKSAQLAQCIQNQIIDTLHTVDRGIKERPGLLVLRGTTMPACLVETAFIDNYDDNQLLQNYKDVFAQCIAQGIVTYLNTIYGTNNTLDLNVTTESEPEVSVLNKHDDTVYPDTPDKSRYKIMDVPNLASYTARTLTNTGVEGAYDSITKSARQDLPSIGCSQWLGGRANELLSKIPGGSQYANRAYSDLVFTHDLEKLKSLLGTPESVSAQLSQLSSDCESYIRTLQQIPGFDDTRCMIYAASWCTTSATSVKSFIERIQHKINFHSLNALASEFAAGYVDAFLTPLGINPEIYRQGYSNRSWNVYYYVAAIDLTTDYGIPEYGKGIYGR